MNLDIMGIVILEGMCTVHGIMHLYTAAWTILTFLLGWSPNALNIYEVRRSASNFYRTCIENYNSCLEIPGHFI